MNSPASRVFGCVHRGAALLALLYVALVIALLSYGFPHEDAFILFKYARNVACGNGIVFYAGGPHAEGATDFLWMILLAAARVIGINVAVAAALLNGLGFYFVAKIFLEGNADRTPANRAVRWVAITLVFGTSAAIAGARGFSAMLYSACALLALTRTIAPSSRASNEVPLYALLLGLLRPDGVILGGGLTVLAAIRAYKYGHFRDFAIRAGIAFAIGAIYFVWRWHYFGSLLPLPLYVKEHYNTGVPPGLEVTFDWCASTLAPLGIAAVFSRLVLGPVKTRDDVRLRAIGVALVPFAIHVASFIPSAPTQNVVNRFEAPAQLALLYFVTQLLTAQRERPPHMTRVAAVSMALIAAFFPVFRLAWFELQDAFWGQYPSALSRDLGALTDVNTKIAATEAGRVLYFARGPVLDLVGLNTRETALAPPSRELLRDFDPDVVMIHHAGSIMEPTIVDDGSDIIEIHDALVNHVPEVVRRFMADNLPPYSELHLQNVFVAATATEGFLDDSRDRYDVYAVRFSSRFFHFHIFAIKKNWPRKQALLDALVRAHAESDQHSYLEFSPAFGFRCDR
ncbi:MAG: hypothetical protein ABI461_10065 [Polyangiaceae bacterium]